MRYHGYARHPQDDRIRLLLVTIASPGTRTTQEWVEMGTTYKTPRAAETECWRRNRNI